MCDSIDADIKKLNDRNSHTRAIEKAETEIQKLQDRIDVLLDSLSDKTITKAEYTRKSTQYKEQIETYRATIKKLKADDNKKGQVKLLLEMKKQIEYYSNLSDDELNEELFARVTEKIVVHPEHILEFHLSFITSPLFMQYTTKGRGKSYTADFTILSKEQVVELIKKGKEDKITETE